jgi:AraC-like DNA-binding protein
MKISVKALPIKDVISDLAKAFDVELCNENEEYFISLPPTIGTGFIRGTNFKSGLGIIQYQCTFFHDIEIHFTSDKTHPLKFIFCTEGKVSHSFENSSEIHTIHTFQNIIVSSIAHNGHVLYFSANEVTNVASLEIIREQFTEYMTYEFDGLNPGLQKVIEDSKSKEQFLYEGNYSITTADIVEQIQKKELSGFLRSIFLEGKTFEMLSKQVTQYQDDQREDSQQIMRKTDVKKIKMAVNIIGENLNHNYSVEELAKEVGTNVNKLQVGFKHMFGLTVNKYMQQVKLEAAKKMLSSAEHNVSQIVSQIGLNNRSYFSKIFKEKYGVSPKYFLTSNGEAKEKILGELEISDEENASTKGKKHSKEKN